MNDTIDRLHEEEDAMISMKGVQCSEKWYLYSGYSTHMTVQKDWFVKISRAMNNKVKLAYGITLMANGIGGILITRKDGGHSLIKGVLYILGIKCNLLIIGQLLEKGYKIHMENKRLYIFLCKWSFGP